MGETPSVLMQEIDQRVLSTFTVPPSVFGPPSAPKPSDLQRLLDLGYFGDSLGRGYGYPSSTIRMVEYLFGNPPSEATDA